ncbi:MAG: S8 family serine peptidase [Phycisphaeraceae bacterium]|nr:S8 family serine peptidase [Phycisphaeraceae bacterium]
MPTVRNDARRGDGQSVKHTATGMMDSLEQRTLLSGADGLGSLTWYGTPLEVKQGAWVVSFDEPLGETELQARVQEVASKLRIEVADVRSIARGRYAAFTTTNRITDLSATRTAGMVDGVKSILPDFVSKSSRIPNDEFFTFQWGHDNTGQFIPGLGNGLNDADADSTNAWDITIGSQSVIIAVIDTGVDINHPDLAANIWRNPGEIPGNGIDDDGNGFVDDVFGWDFGDLDNDPSDEDGHGTHVAGIIGAVGNNGIGVAGVAWNVSILPIKAVDESGSFPFSATLGAYDYIVTLKEAGHNIVASNNSYGAFAPLVFEQFLQDQKDAIQRTIDAGIVFVAAAGNDGADIDAIEEQDRTAFPAGYDLPGIISVAATDNSDGLAGFSNYGAREVDLGAPGVQILSTVPGGGYAYFSGTSMASPFVAGAVAMIASARPGASPVELRTALMDSTDPVPSLQNRVQSGGRLNVWRAVQLISRDGPVVTSFAPGPVFGQLFSTGQPVDTLTLTFNKPIDSGFLGTAGVSVIGAGLDDIFGNGDDITIPVSAVAVSGSNPNVVTVTLNLSGFPSQRLPLDIYRITIDDFFFRDTAGNYLNGNTSGGFDTTLNFRVVPVSGTYEPNDVLLNAIPVTFDVSGKASFTGLRIGDGLQSTLDVDLFRIDMPKGGLITAEVVAKRLPVASTLDSYIRLFDAFGQQIAANDQFFGQDAYLDYFVSTGGTYYIGVSGFGNPSYNPTLAGSGSSQSTGVYNLLVGSTLITDDRVTVEDSLTAPLRIPAVGTQGVATNSILVRDTRQILDLNVRVNIEHTFVGDLRLILAAPDGTETILYNRRGSSGINITNTFFDDEAANAISGGTAPFTGAFRPDQPLNRFDGKSAAGTWTLRIVDTTSLNDGQLLSWSLDFTLRNDVFGALESNDTLVTARVLQEINGNGAATRSASIGDGGFGVLDRDIFRFVASQGTTLNATVTSGGNLDTALRLFDAEGNELRFASLGGTLNAVIDDFVFSEGGVYYIAVSEASNLNYDPFDVTSGVAAATTGTYTLNVTVAPGVSDQPVVVRGNNVAAGVGSDGTLFARDSEGNPVGLSFNDIEFLFPSTNPGVTNFYGGTANGYNFLNNGTIAASSLPVVLTDESEVGNRRVSVSGSFRGLQLNRSIAYSNNDNFAVVDVFFRNTTSASVANVAWMEGMKPSQGINIGGTSTRTINDVDPSGKVATARFTTNSFEEGLTIALAAPDADSRAVASFLNLGTTVRDPLQLISFGVNDPNGLSADQVMTMAFDIGTIAPGQTASVRYFVFFGNTPADVDGMLAQLNNGTGTGHLTANSATPQTEILSEGTPVPTLPYRVYYPEGFANSKTFTAIPIMNPNDEPTRVVIIARYASGERDQVIKDVVIAGNSRGGATLVTPTLFANDTLLVRKNTPYAIEIRSERPVAAQFSHYDEFILKDRRAAIGEAFTNRTDTTWTFGQIEKGSNVAEALVYYNTTAETIKVTSTFFPTGGGAPIEVVQQIEAFRRGGINIRNNTSIPSGSYGVTVTADVPIVASLSHYGLDNGNAYGMVGTPGAGTAIGAVPEGQLGLNSVAEVVGVLNATATPATIIFSFLYQDGSAYRTSLNVPARQHAVLDVASLPNFPLGTPYSVLYESNVAVSMSLPTQAFNDGLATSFSSQAYTYWGFGEGYRPRNDGIVTEYLRLFNPTTEDVVVEITLQFGGASGVETFRRVLSPRRVAEFDIHDFVLGERRNSQQFYGITVKAASPIVAYMGRYDRFFPGGFGTLGTPLGTSQLVV